jgi:DNA replication protein DnaC
MSTDAIKCARCGAAIHDLTMEELSSVESIFKRPLILCDGCIATPPEQPCTQKRTTDSARPLPPWTSDWTERAIGDLKHFTGEPLAKARQLLPYVEGNGTIAIIGDRGRGKTVMATWFAEQRRQKHQPPGTYIRALDLFVAIRKSWLPHSMEDEWSALEGFRKTPFLVIDEFQERSDSDWENRLLVNILDHRHGSLLPTVIIANLDMEAFSQTAGPSLVSRISQTGGIVQCRWSNFRSHQPRS